MMRQMFDWRRALIAVPVLALVAVGAYVLIPRGPDASTPRATLVDTPASPGVDVGVRKGQLGRDFAGQGPDGAAVRLSDLRGKPTIINFWATWCGSCVAELPDFKEVQLELGAENLNVVAVNAGEGSGDARRFLDSLHVPDFYITMDPTLIVSDAYGVFGMPTSVFLDANGVIRAVYTGQLDKDLMREYVRAASDGTTTDEPPTKIRLVTAIARDHTLEVRSGSGDTVELSSKSLRCDESYCGTAAIDTAAAHAGVQNVDRRVSDDPPRIIVTFDAGVTSATEIANALADALSELGDPLYERPLEVIEK
ncbi:MAG: TlpA family protein disulfide reductase [Chloroflexi bacterium]|nr:TlpA family protein disulfide reductase [Chloroflexota bacterium]